MQTLHLPCETGRVSDGIHTFDDLYEHRNVLMLSLMRADPKNSWVVRPSGEWFWAGYDTPDGPVAYLLAGDLWQIALCTGCRVLDQCPAGEPAEDDLCVSRLVRMVMRSSTDTDSVKTGVDPTTNPS